MNTKFLSFCEELSADIQRTYEESVTIEEAEKLAAKFLSAQLMLTSELQKADLDARMKKSGTKAVKAAVYLEEATKTDKKPSDVMLNNLVDSNELAAGEQERFDQAENYREMLQNYFNVFKEAHIYYRGISKGRFE